MINRPVDSFNYSRSSALAWIWSCTSRDLALHFTIHKIRYFLNNVIQLLWCTMFSLTLIYYFYFPLYRSFFLLFVVQSQLGLWIYVFNFSCFCRTLLYYLFMFKILIWLSFLIEFHYFTYTIFLLNLQIIL